MEHSDATKKVDDKEHSKKSKKSDKKLRSKAKKLSKSRKHWFIKFKIYFLLTFKSKIKIL